MAANSDWLEHCAAMRERLLELRTSLGDNKEVQLWLDEYLEANELELALHVICDFLLERTSRQIETEELTLIRTLHEQMNIADDCCSRLQQRQR
jgi:hypothetical protein